MIRLKLNDISAAVLAAFVIAAGPGAATAQTAAPTPSRSTESFQDWAVECTSVQQAKAGEEAKAGEPAKAGEEAKAPEAAKLETVRLCEAVQTYRNNKTGNEVARLAFAYDAKDGNKLLAGMRLMVDVSFEKAPEIVDGDAAIMTGKVVRCAGQYCYAEFTVAKDSVDKLKAAKSAAVRYPISNGRTISIGLSSKGLADALKTLESR